jgi:hypothetical protein
VDPHLPPLPLPAIEALPTADRAVAYLALHDELLARLEAVPAAG